MWIAALLYDLVRTMLRMGEGTITGGVEHEDARGAARPDVDPHNFGLALDLRTSDLDSDQLELLLDRLNAVNVRLGSPWRWVAESDHLHVQLNNWRAAAGL